MFSRGRSRSKSPSVCALRRFGGSLYSLEKLSFEIIDIYGLLTGERPIPTMWAAGHPACGLGEVKCTILDTIDGTCALPTWANTSFINVHGLRHFFEALSAFALCLTRPLWGGFYHALLNSLPEPLASLSISTTHPRLAYRFD